MATIVEGLFGPTPEMYQRQQSASADERALQYAKLDPFQQANFAIGRGAYGLAGGIGGALGGQDPELQTITRRHQLASQIDLTDLESIKRGIVQLQQSGDTVGMTQLAEIYRKTELNNAVVGKDNAAAAASGVSKQTTTYREAQESAQLKAEIARLTALPQTPERDAALNYLKSTLSGFDPKPTPKSQDAGEIATLESQLTNLNATGQGASPEARAIQARVTHLKGVEKDVSFGAEAERVARELYGKTFDKLTQPEQAAVNKRVEATVAAGATKVTTVIPGQARFVDIPKARRDVQQTIEPHLKTVTIADQALQAINDSLATGNFVAFRAAQSQLARAISGAGDLSKSELQAAGADPSLLGGGIDYLAKLMSSTPSEDTQKKIRSTLRAIRTVAAKKANLELNQQRKIATLSNYTKEEMDTLLDFPELKDPNKTTKKTITLPSGAQVTVED